MTTGEKIAALRKEQGMSQEALGEKLGLSRQAVSKWEADQAVPTMDNLMELSKLFGVPVDTLLRPDAELMPKAEDSDESWPGAENQPVRNENRKWKIAAIAAAGLLCVSVVCSAVSLWRVLAMQKQIDTLRMQSGPSTIYYPDNTSAENSDLADWSENVTVDRQNTDNLLVTVSAVPRSMMDGETAKFVVRSGDQSWECDAEDNNSNSGEEIQPVSGRILLYQNGKQIKEQKITSLGKEFDGDTYYYTQVDWRDMEGTLSQFKVKVEITDNFDRTYTADVD